MHRRDFLFTSQCATNCKSRTSVEQLAMTRMASTTHKAKLKTVSHSGVSPLEFTCRISVFNFSGSNSVNERLMPVATRNASA